MSTRKLSVTITGPEGMLDAMAKLLRDEGYHVLSPVEHVEGVRIGADFWREVDATVADGNAAVLKAIRGMTEAALRSYLVDGSGGLPAVCRAELVARGLTP